MFFSPTGFPSRMLERSTSGVLAALRGSTYRSARIASSLAATLLGIGRVFARQGWACEKSGLLEHPLTLLIVERVDRFS